MKHPALAVAALVAALTLPRFSALAETSSHDFEAYSAGTIHNQDGWLSAGSVGSGCAAYDHKVVVNAGAPASFAARSLRMSNAVTSGCFGDQTFSKPLVDEAGETGADGGALSGGARQATFEAQWDFATTVPAMEQAGLSVVASPDRGDGARMSWVQMADTPSGLAVNFNDFQAAPGSTCATAVGFVATNVASGLDRGAPHTIKLHMQFIDGPANDIVKVYVDGSLAHTGTSWEEYFRLCEGNPTRTVDSVLFRTAGAAAPATAGKGFRIDNLGLTSGPLLVGPPTNKDQCKDGGWSSFNNPVFANQGDCVSFVTGKHKP